MKIEQFVQKLRTGGAETVATTYAITLNSYPMHTAEVVVYDGREEDTPNEERLRKAGVKIFFASNRQRWYYKHNNIFARMIRSLIRHTAIIVHIYKEKPDVIHFNGTPIPVIKLIASVFPHIKLVYTIHSELSNVFSNDDDIAVTKKLVANNKLQMIALHSRMQQECNKLFGIHSTVVINNGIDVDKIRAAKSCRAIYRANLHYTDENFVIGHVGSMLPVKNHTFLLDVFDRVIHRVPEARLLLVGSGELHEEVMGKAEKLGFRDKVTWLEKREDIPELLAAMDYFVFPSLYEGLPLSVLEAQAAGLPVLLSSAVTDEVMVTNHIYQMPLECGADKWADEIIHPREYSHHDRLEMFNIKNMAERLLAIYQENSNEDF